MKDIIARAAIAVCFFGMFELESHATVITQTYSGTLPTTVTGTLPDQGSVLEESFTLPTASDLAAFTTSYANGGFEPNLTLFDSMGNFVTGEQTAGTSPIAGADSVTGLALDGYLTAPDLPAGTYTLTLTDFLLNQSLTATNLSDGFTVNYGSGTTSFVDEMGNSRSSSYSLTLEATPAVQMSGVPEPGTIWLAAPFMAGLFILAKKDLYVRK